MEWPRITKETSIEELEEIHKRIWDYAIEHARKPVTPYVCNCVACQYALCHNHSGGPSMCSHCPIEWPGCMICRSEDSLHDKWYRANLSGDLDLAKKFATEIRDVKFRIN